MTGSRYIEQNDAPSQYRWRCTGLSVLALCLVWLAGRACADTTRAPESPIGPATVPPSSYEKSSPASNSTAGDRSASMNLPGPMDTSGNLLITGNVEGGKYFHGYVPYRSPTSLGAPLGSTQLDSFLRYTSAPPERSGYAGGYSPFYSPTGTAATTRPGYGGAVLVPSSPRVASGLPVDRPADALTLTEMAPYQAGAYDNYDGSASTVPGRTPGDNFGLRIADYGLNPGRESAIANPQSAISALTPPGVTTNTQPAALPSNGLMTPEDYRLQLQQLQQDIERVKTNAMALEQSLRTNDPRAVRVIEPQPAQAAEPGVPVTPGGAVTLPQEQPALPGGPGRPDEGLLPDKTPVPGGLRSVSSPRDTGVQWLPPRDQTDGIARPGVSPLRAPLSAARPEPSMPASTAATERIGAVFALPGRPDVATGNRWTELPALQVQQMGPTAPGTSNSPLGGFQRSALPAQGVKPSPEQVSAYVARLRATSAAGNPAADPAGNSPAGTVPDPSQQLLRGRLFQTYRNPAGAFALPESDQNTRVAASRPQASGTTDGAMAPAPNSGTTASLTQERFDRCLGTAELYLRQGLYYRAAELFAAAAAYQPTDGRALLGQSYALFGAGEYLSSALDLARALELDPRAVLGRSDLVNAIGGPAVFAARITDLEQCAGAGDAPQLQFLLAYVYGQMNRPVEAKAALAAAEQQLSPSPALDLLKAIVNRP